MWDRPVAETLEVFGVPVRFKKLIPYFGRKEFSGQFESNPASIGLYEYDPTLAETRGLEPAVLHSIVSK